MPKYFGKYRAEVTNVYDDRAVDDRGVENRGRIKVKCPSVLGEYESSWCEPCFPYCYDLHGDFVLPERGDTVWVEFEEGNANKPIWVGSWFKKDSTPINNEKSRDETPATNAGSLNDYKEHHDKVRVIQYGRFWVIIHRDPDYMRVYVDDGKLTEFFTDLNQVYLERSSGKMRFYSDDEVTYLHRDDSEIIMIDSDTQLFKAGSNIKLESNKITITAENLDINVAHDYNLNVDEGDIKETLRLGNITRKTVEGGGDHTRGHIMISAAETNSDEAWTFVDDKHFPPDYPVIHH